MSIFVGIILFFTLVIVTHIVCEVAGIKLEHVPIIALGLFSYACWINTFAKLENFLGIVIAIGSVVIWLIYIITIKSKILIRIVSSVGFLLYLYLMYLGLNALGIGYATFVEATFPIISLIPVSFMWLFEWV